MKSEHKELTQYFSQQTESIKEIHQQLTEHLDQRFTIAELSKQYLINTSFIIRRGGTEIIIQEGKLLNREILSSGTAEGIETIRAANIKKKGT